ncbi:MAG: DUF4112 domain-containing protein [Deltaproteobacteria bacterium]|nr:MAG: DUF4112 domain-containing protein [Deltaproteobacteria bacterium]
MARAASQLAAKQQLNESTMTTRPLPSTDDIDRAVTDVLDAHGDGEAEPDVGGPRVVLSEDVKDVESPAWAEKLVRLLDDGLTIPGTNFGIGLDGFIGALRPGVGDVLTGSGSLALIYLAFKERVPTVALARMVLNIAIDTLFGSLPVIGDTFDVFWKSNRKNLDLIERYRADPAAKPTFVDYLLVVLAVLLVIAGVVIPLVLFWVLLGGGVFAVGGLIGE